MTVAYTKPATNPLQTSAGGQAASLTAQNVTNNVAAVIPAYVSSVIDNATPSTLTLTYNLSLANIVPTTSAFTVRVNSTTRTVSSVAVSGTRVILTLASPGYMVMP
ncbi:MAG: SwmB domain-containing protein [Bacteroidales bacterium]|nr:SwmB domain-containing protein [Bacteroidales bacterium]